ncbi:MAG: bifunctional nuclease family protein [Planctomycetota bacterium]
MASGKGAAVLVRMKLSRILIRELTDYQLIELREALEADQAGTREPRSFPIVIGLPEAQAIERRLQGTPLTRPQTHDLLANVIESMGGRIERIAITSLSGHTFFAELTVGLESGESLGIDCRPSDAIALGVATSAPIFVEETVLESASREDA